MSPPDRYEGRAYMAKQVVPLGTDYRIPEQGRIRLGVKTERAMKSIDTFRFTSQDECAIRDLADIYGGVAEPWTPQRSKDSQWEVITSASEIRVFLPPDSIDVCYEEWSGGGLVRRCDGVTMTVPVETPDGVSMDEAPCWCASQQEEKDIPMSCRPHTRLRVILPDIRFGGIWRLESKGWHASKELPGMAQILEQLQAIGIVEGRLVLEKRTKVSGGKTKKFVVPRLITNTTPSQILKGSARIQVLEEAPTNTIELEPVVDAEIVEVTEVSTEGWDIPPPGIKVKKNTGAGPRYVKAD